MIQQLSLWYFIDRNLERKIPVMLLYVLQSEGSSPGRQGFSMAVNALGDITGSVGGGIMEHKFVEMAKERLQYISSEVNTTDNDFILKKQVHDKAAAQNQSGMICSGEQTILLYPVTEEDSITIKCIIYSLQQFNNGTLTLHPGGIQFTENVPAVNFEYTITAENDWTYKEKTGYKNKLVIIGGGHCALALCQLMSQMDYYIVLYDDRDGLNTIENNSFVNHKKIITDYSQLASMVKPATNVYVVIMTVGYRTDYIALKALLGRAFKYIGVLGSKKKMEKLFADFKEEGIDPEKLESVYTPIGVNINSHTPQEIAVSIAAEIIMVKNKTIN